MGNNLDLNPFQPQSSKCGSPYRWEILKNNKDFGHSKPVNDMIKDSKIRVQRREAKVTQNSGNVSSDSDAVPQTLNYTCFSCPVN